MAFIRGEGRNQITMFPVTLEELIPADHVCRVLEAFVDKLDMESLGFERAEPAETGRPGYDPRDLLRLYLYGYLHQIRASRRLEAECRRNVEVMWLLGRLTPDHKSIAEFRRLHSEAVTEVGVELIRFARSAGLVRGEWVAIDGSKFQAVSSSQSVHDRKQWQQYLERIEEADTEEEVEIDSTAVATALEKLQQHPEPEARFMRTRTGKVPAYNVQTAVDAEQALIVAQKVTDETTDNRSLQSMAEAAQAAVGQKGQAMHVVADSGYCNAQQAAQCEAQGMIIHVPAHRGVNNQGDGTLFDRSQFQYQPESDTFRCPAGETLKWHARKGNYMVYAGTAKICGTCPLKSHCTLAKRRLVKRHIYDSALDRMQEQATPEAMRLRKSIVEHPFAALKYRIFGHPRFLLRGIRGAQAEISIAVMVYNLKRMMSVLGGLGLKMRLQAVGSSS